MKKIIIILIIVHASLFTLHSLKAQVKEPKVTTSVFFGISKPIRDLPIVIPGIHQGEQKIFRNRFPRWGKDMRPGSGQPDKPALQKTQGSLKSRGPLLNFEGVGNEIGGSPADPNGEVGINHYVQTVNCSYAVWDKSGNMLFGPVDYQTIWASFPGPWNTYFWSDPIIKYDHMADRWVMISMSYNGNNFYTMIAVSTTPDPIGSYYCYAYYFTDWNDYLKLSIWPDGYYVTCNFWDSEDDSFMYSLATVVDRDAMLNGAASATMIQFQVPNSDEGNFFPLPADCRGANIPANKPCYVTTLGSHNPYNFWQFSLDVYAFDTDWEVPINSSLEWISQFDIGEFEPLTAFGPGAPQLGSDINVMTIPVYLMYPLTYRIFENHEAMTACHTVWDGETHYIKWYELRKDSSAWYIYQTGNYSPGDDHYFMGSISINGNGDIALGYSISGEDMYTSIQYTGRRAEDSLGMMTLEALELYKGLNYANTYQADFDQNRWGDYSSMMVDPSDDSTFWYTNMYPLATTTLGNWATRIFSLNISGNPVMPYAFAGNDTLVHNVLFFETQGEAENYSSIVWTTSGDGTFITNYAENVIYLRGSDDLANGQVVLIMHLTGYYAGTGTSDSMILYLSPVVIEESPVKEMALQLFPNPARDLMTLRAVVPANNTLIVEIIGLEGKAVFTGRYTPVNSHFELQFDISHLTPGIYLIRMQTIEGKAIKKLAVRGG